MARASENGGLAASDYKAVLGHFCSGVTVITAISADGPVGFSCQSFSSLSLDPPLICFCPARTSSTWPHIRESGQFCVNILAADQQGLCRQFAMSGADKFAGITWHPASNGAPRLEGAIASLTCALEREVDGGDHTIVIGRVIEAEVQSVRPPLLFHRSAFKQLAPEPDPRSSALMPLDTWRWG
ncbi:flavin reductase family protein [Nocardia cerradoensis]|uniref:Flavin-dependent monooxygenase, reductase subunit HsaB n=1 Tax=Nocardia cerradoensis TaxID=85688 RepID=A0A231GTD5_9NOCA|nr:flavin reductase family protein [Nocardia cerradoensis]NKY43668.1 flavin reductase family protein [Nocardia cerradoensis]OXR39879.1 Flavin-dependent monooxygenase, reductase subunit HsaB [Nocardia cerradoensis]